MATFTQFVKTPSSPTVYGKSSDGQWVAFETESQFSNSGGDFSKVQTVSAVPSGAVNFSQYNQPSQQATQPSQPKATTKPVSTPPPAGVNQALWDQLGAADKAFVQALNTQAQNTYQQGQANYSINAQTMQQALQLAQNDPTIKAEFGDQSKMALNDLHNNLGYINAEYAQQFGLQTAEQAKARQQLTESEAAAGRAQSGFRQQAQDLQQQQQNAVIQSSQRQLQQQVRNIGSQYESRFGSQALAQAGPIQAGGQSYTPYGGITGSQPIAQKQAVEQKQLQTYGTISNPLNK